MADEDRGGSSLHDVTSVQVVLSFKTLYLTLKLLKFGPKSYSALKLFIADIMQGGTTPVLIRHIRLFN